MIISRFRADPSKNYLAVSVSWRVLEREFGFLSQGSGSFWVDMITGAVWLFLWIGRPFVDVLVRIRRLKDPQTTDPDGTCKSSRHRAPLKGIHRAPLKEIYRVP